MKNEPEKKVLFSFLMICYKQEKYIARAMESALAQKDPIELIVSDDHSPDQTFEIAKEVAARYHGPHKILLNRNPENLGIGANFCRAAEFAHGEWLFMAAGDDISLPDRTQKIRDAVRRYPRALAFGAPRIIIDAGENVLGYEDWNKNLHGASAAWHRSLFSKFPPIPARINVEDLILYFRVFLLHGESVVLNTPLIQYRNDGLSHKRESLYEKHLARSVMKLEIAQKALNVRLRDSDCPGLPVPEEFRRLLQERLKEHLRKTGSKLLKLRQRSRYLQMGFSGFWKGYLTGTLEPRPALKELLRVSLLFFKHPAEHKLDSLLPVRDDIVVTVERYLNEPGQWDF